MAEPMATIGAGFARKSDKGNIYWSGRAWMGVGVGWHWISIFQHPDCKDVYDLDSEKPTFNICLGGKVEPQIEERNQRAGASNRGNRRGDDMDK